MENAVGIWVCIVAEAGVGGVGTVGPAMPRGIGFDAQPEINRADSRASITTVDLRGLIVEKGERRKGIIDLLVVVCFSG